MLLSDRVASMFMTRSPAGLVSSVPKPRPFWPSKRRRPSRMTILPAPRDSPIGCSDTTTSYEPSSPIVSAIGCASELDLYTTPFHVPATDLTSETGTGVRGPRLAQPSSEAANPTTKVAPRTIDHHRKRPGVIAPPRVEGEPSRTHQYSHQSGKQAAPIPKIQPGSLSGSRPVTGRQPPTSSGRGGRSSP